MNATTCKTLLSLKSVEALEAFSEKTDLLRLQRNLRSVVFQYLHTKHDELMDDFECFIKDLDQLFYFLDIIMDEEKGKDIPE
ncbi:hypothetical protein [Reichenbachiella versicolor]|uniref:hypothetical protein n=1 Tax=Reichenbachiella versicolor TaxID=1821036 RepID=UPI000D6E7DC4|nr:hypothetical protein [Reichenbachiella versicolor]